MSFFSGGFGGLIGAAGGVLSGILGSNSAQSIAADANAFNAQQAQLNRDFQKEVFQNQLQWKAADARKAGLHPLAAIGGGSYSGSPVSVSAVTPNVDVPNLGALGRSIGDALDAYMTREERQKQQAMVQQRDSLVMEKAGLENDLLRAQIAESQARAKSYTVPMASGREIMKGQTDSPPAHVTPDGLIIHPTESTTGSLFGQNYDINLHPDLQAALGDEAGQVYNMLRKATRENRGSYFDKSTGTLYLFDRDAGYWYIPYSGGGGGV